MNDQKRDLCISNSRSYERCLAPDFSSRLIETREVFEQMIEDEVRCGRLTRARRRRIVQYAAHLGLSAVEAGRFIERCRHRVDESSLADQALHERKGVAEIDSPATSLKIARDCDFSDRQCDVFTIFIVLSAVSLVLVFGEVFFRRLGLPVWGTP